MRVRNRDAERFIRERKPFMSHTGNFSGRDHSGIHVSGRLPSSEKESFYAAVDDPQGYVVYSYSTPIAWYTQADGWIISGTRYSVSTSRHQSVVRNALR